MYARERETVLMSKNLTKNITKYKSISLSFSRSHSLFVRESVRIYAYACGGRHTHASAHSHMITCTRTFCTYTHTHSQSKSSRRHRDTKKCDKNTRGRASCCMGPWPVSQPTILLVETVSGRASRGHRPSPTYSLSTTPPGKHCLPR